MALKLFIKFMAAQQGCDPNDIIVEVGSPMKMIELLWVFNDGLQVPAVKRFVDVMPYDPRGEQEFDMMIEALAADPFSYDFRNTLDATLTVWNRRLKQAMDMMTTLIASGQTTPLPPRDMEKIQQQAAAACLWLHKPEY